MISLRNLGVDRFEKSNKSGRLFLLLVFMVLSFGVIACEEDAQKNQDAESGTEETNAVTNTDNNLDSQQDSPKETPSQLSEDDIVNLVESIDPYELEPSMTVEERYKLRNELYQSIPEEDFGSLTGTITELSLLLTGTVADDLYKNLINKNNPKWDALEVSNCYYAREKLESITHLTSNHQPLLDDLNMVIEHCEEGVKQRDILKIVDAHRILYDISNHFFGVPYDSPTEIAAGVTSNYSDIHDVYFKASKTLERSHSLISK